jgi:ADP-ribosyl-[dinitrogen reductase] hydrolase
VRAVNLGGEADTIAAVAGGAAGACWGQAALPARWREALHDRERIERIATRLAALRRHQEIYAARTEIPPFEFFRVEERVWAGRNPLTARDVDRLASLGVTHVLDLREPKEWSGGGRVGQEAVDALDERGIERRHLPVPDTHAPDAATLDAAVGFLDAALAADPAARVFVHCRAGQQRTGAVLVAWHARSRGCTGHDALAAIQASCPSIAPMEAQRQAVERWLDDR